MRPEKERLSPVGTASTPNVGSTVLPLVAEAYAEPGSQLTDTEGAAALISDGRTGEDGNRHGGREVEHERRAEGQLVSRPAAQSDYCR